MSSRPRLAVGRRRGRPVILTIRAEAINRAGHAFYLPRNGVWLTHHVPDTPCESKPEA